MVKEINEQATSDPGPLEKMIQLYQRSPVLRMLVKTNPYSAVAEVGVLASYEWFRARRLETFGR
jgi:hypothetical protein